MTTMPGDWSGFSRRYLDDEGREELKGVWVGGLFAGGKFYLVKVLRFLWEDNRFGDGTVARRGIYCFSQSC